MMEKEDMKIVLVGHIDHGKSTLIGRLLYDTDSLSESRLEDIKYEAEKSGKDIEFAFVMDHLKEERERKITIDTAQTFFSTDKRKYVIIDAPGHKEFIKNMITGASQAEAAVLLVDVDEGIQEQTKRHAYILSLLGIEQVIVAMNKMDLVGYDKKRFEQIKEDLLKFLSEIKIKPSFIVPISAKKGDSIAKKSKKMEWYKGPTIVEALDKFKTKPSSVEKPLRFPVQDVYKIGGEEIVVGRIESGKIRAGQEVFIFPENLKAKVKEIKKYKENPIEAEAGESIGIVLDEKVKRGYLVSGEEKPKEKSTIKANLFWLSPEALNLNEKLIFKCTTQEVPCKTERIKERIDSSSLKVLEKNAGQLKEYEIGKVEITLEHPVFVDNFNDVPELGRFVVERNGIINGGGIIL